MSYSTIVITLLVLILLYILGFPDSGPHRRLSDYRTRKFAQIVVIVAGVLFIIYMVTVIVPNHQMLR